MSNGTPISNTPASHSENLYNPSISSDDNDNLELQKKIPKFETMQLYNNDDENIQSVSTPIQFSIEVKVDEIDTDTPPTANSSEQETQGTHLITNTEVCPSDNEEKVFYIRKILSDTQQVDRKSNYTSVKQYTITNETIMKAILEQSKENIEDSDKHLDIFCRNLHGQFKSITLSFIDKEVNRVMRIWSKWYKMYPMFRGTPLMYKCYICSKGWWRLHPFKEHLEQHKYLDFKLRPEPIYHRFNIIASTVKDNSIKNVEMDSNCWKCGRDATFHEYSHSSVKYHCQGCNKSMVTCTRLKEHESTCVKNIQLTCKKYNVDPSEAITCIVCDICCVNEEVLDAHMIEYHLVRSDEPTVLETSLCKFCRCRYFICKFHDCPAKEKAYKCEVCCRRFSLKILCQVHMRLSRGRAVKCTVCEKLITQCMAPEHYLKHSKNYNIVNMCRKCNTDLLFTNEKFYLTHMKAHSKRYPLEQILLPRKCLNGEISKSETAFQIPDQNLTNFMAGLEDSEGKPIDIDKKLKLEEVLEADVPNIPDATIANADSEMQLTVVEPTVNSALNSQSVPEKEFDIKAMQKQLDEEIMKDMELEATICKIFQASKSYQLLMEKESMERQSEENMASNEANMQEIIEKESVHELTEKKFTEEKPEESLKTELMDLEENNALYNDLIILDNGVEDVNATYYNETEGQPESSKGDKESSPKNQSDMESEDIIIDCNSSGSEQNSDWDASTIVDVGSEVFIQEKVKPCPSEDLSQKVQEGQTVANKTEATKTDAGCQLYECKKKRCGYKGPWKRYMVHISTECPGTVFNCCSCESSARFDNLRDYLEHLYMHDYKTLSCPECKVKLKTSYKQYIHVSSHIQNLFSRDKSVEQLETSYYCKRCDHYVPVDDFFTHWQLHLNEERDGYSSEESTDSNERDGLKKAMSEELIKEVTNLLQNKNRERTMTNCIVCLRKSPRWQECKRHLIEHLLTQAVYTRKKTKSGMLKCYFCDKVFKTAFDWKFHMREHSNLRVYRCELCTKCFCDSSNLSKHRKAHNLFSFECDMCGGKFQIKRSLIRHIKMHDKALKCKMCNMPFLGVRKLKNHIASQHADVDQRRYKCWVCDRQFLTWKLKMQHMFLQHDKRAITADCPVCEAQFRKPSDVKRHMKLKHSTDYSDYLRRVN